MRNTSWDNLPHSVENLKSKIRKEGQEAEAFKKSNETNSIFNSSIEDLAVAYVDVSKLSKQVYDEFTALKKDYDNKVINMARYKAALEPLNSLLTGMDTKVKILGFNTTEIAKALKEVGY